MIPRVHYSSDSLDESAEGKCDWRLHLRYDVTDVNDNAADPIERVIHVIHPLAVSTQEPEQIGSYQATFVGAIDHYGIKPVVEHGFVYDRDPNKTNVVEAEGVMQLGR